MLESIAAANKITVRDLQIKSGGAALSDHVAVKLFLEGKISKLHLHLPCGISVVADSGSVFFSSSSSASSQGSKTASSANQHHRNFYTHLEAGLFQHQRDSFHELYTALTNGTTYDISDGFFSRNSLVASCDYMIAFTFPTSSTADQASIRVVQAGEENAQGILQGGTRDTWLKAKKSVRIHIPIV
jgi:hypothetical protein